MSERVDTTNPRSFLNDYAQFDDHQWRRTPFMRGDLLEFKRKILGITFEHWAVFVGYCDDEEREGAVIHFSPTNSPNELEILERLRREDVEQCLPAAWFPRLRSIGALALAILQRLLGRYIRNARIRCDYLKGVAGNSEFRINNCGDSEICSPYDAETIFKRANDRLGDANYSILDNNCEHFVTDCRYGYRRSKQADKFREKKDELEEEIKNLEQWDRDHR